MQTDTTHQPSEHGRPLIPRGEVPCVWMNAGVINFRLCDRGLDCAGCPLDRALGNLPEPKNPARTCRIDEDRFYHPAHLWVRVRSNGELETGLDDLATRLLGPVTAFRGPSAGDLLTAGIPAAELDAEAATISIPAPFDGEVTEVNPALADRPALVGEEPCGDGWLYRARAAEPTRVLATLLAGPGAREWKRREEDRIRELVEVARPASAGEGPGPVAQDGGELADRLLAGLPAGAARTILAKVLGAVHATAPLKENHR